MMLLEPYLRTFYRALFCRARRLRWRCDGSV